MVRQVRKHLGIFGSYHHCGAVCCLLLRSDRSFDTVSFVKFQLHRAEIFKLFKEKLSMTTSAERWKVATQFLSLLASKKTLRSESLISATNCEVRRDPTKKFLFSHVFCD